MENRSCQQAPAPVLSRSHSSKRLKFKQLPLDDFNELNSKYELYKRGTPNSYGEDLTALRVRNIRNDVATMELPAVDSIISQLSQAHSHPQNEKQINQRNYDLYPNLLKQPKARYKEMLSEKQEIKDFVLWFQGQIQAIDKSNDPYARKFENKQTLIAAGFNEMVGQVGKASKNRAEILKMLWNRENQEVSAIIDILNAQSIKKERGFLEQISKIHHEYQNQIDCLRKNNRELDDNFTKERKFNRTLIENLRMLRKRMKKLEYLAKKLSQSNANTKRENLNLIQENIKLLMSIKDISEEEAVILNYRRLQVYQEKDRLKHHKTKKIIELADPDKGESLAPLQELDEKKKALYDFFLERLKQNPDEKIFIRQEYFTDQEENVASIEEHFKNIINRPNIKMELLNEDMPQPQHRDKAVNTDPQEQAPTSLPELLLEKGIQVQIHDPNMGSFRDRDDQDFLPQRRLCQMISHREQEQLQKQNKKRIIQHRLSRKNSLTLLQIQGLADSIGPKAYPKKPMLSSFAKKNKLNQSEDEHRHLDAIDSDIPSPSQSDIQSETQILAINKLAKGSQLTAINVNTNMVNQRKSIDFHNLLQRINETYQKCNSPAETPTNMIKLDGDQEEQIKYSQLEDLIRKHLLKKDEGKSVQNPQKYLNKLLLALYKNVSLSKHYNFIFQLLQVIKNSYGNIKSVIWKFLSIVTVIRSHANANSLLKIVSIFLKINDQYALYNEVNREELPELYFRLFLLLSIRNVNESSFNLWKACTSLQRIKSIQFIALVEEFFSRKKRTYLENKIEELIFSAQQEGRRGTTSTFKKIDTQDDNAQIVKLNPILLYVLEVYLIEKQTYHASYSEMLEFASTDGYLSVQFLVWIVDFLGFEEQSQNEMLSFIFQSQKNREETQGRNLEKCMKNDSFYKFCLKFDMPLFEELAVAAYARFKQLPLQIQQRYYRMIELEEWSVIRQELVNSYKSAGHSDIYMKAFMLMVEKLEVQIRRGVSIYGEDGQQKIKRKEEVFSLFYKIIIIQAHKHLLQKGHEPKRAILHQHSKV